MLIGILTHTSYVALLFTIAGTDRPILKQLHRYKKDIGMEWYDLGVELLDDRNVKKLNNIRENHKEVEMCCSFMFQTWLGTKPSASWIEFLSALKVVGLSELASKIEAEVVICEQLLNYRLCILYIIIIFICIRTYISTGSNLTICLCCVL